MLSDNNLLQVQQAVEKMTDTVTLVMNGGLGESDFQTALFNIARQISGVSMNRIDLVEGAGSLIPGTPSIGLSVRESTNIYYTALPEENEFAPFLAALKWLGKAEETPGGPTFEGLERMSSQADLKVLMAATCPHCPATVESALAIAIRQPLVSLTVLDALYFPEIADKYKVRSTPTVIVNEGATFVGQVKPEEIVTHLSESGGIIPLVKIVRSMIDTGRAEDAAGLIIERREPQALLPLFMAPEFSTRMGALVVMEEALEREPRSLDSIVPDLTDLLFHEDIPLRGDTAELLGKIGSPDAIPALKKAALDSDPDVREAVQEALEELEG